MLRYDFDILHADRASTLENQVRAVFRDADTRASVKMLPEPVRLWLAGAGFVDRAAESNLPAGQYALRDEAFRFQILQRLAATMKDFDLAVAGKDTWSTFTISDFIDALANAKPAQSDTRAAAPQVALPPMPQIPGPFAGLRGKAAKEALAKAAPRGWHPKQVAVPYGLVAMARRQGLIKLTLGTAFVYCAVLLYMYR